MNRKKGICTGEDAEATDRLLDLKHLAYFKRELIRNGFPKTIKDSQVQASCGFAQSLASYKEGWADHARF